MEIKLDEEGTRRLNEAFQAMRQREGADRDQALLDQEEPDERLRRLVQAEGQLTQAQLCYWGLPTQAVIWAYQAIDNSMHAALLADRKSPSKNHQKKVEEFRNAFPRHAEGGTVDKIADARELWNTVRYDRSAISRETAQPLVDLAYDVYRSCSDVVADRMGVDSSHLDERLTTIADKVRLPVVVRSDAAIDRIEGYNMSKEHQLESMGLSGIVSQVAHGGRDIFMAIAADQAWARELLEEDSPIAEEIANLNESFHEIVTGLIAKRVSQMLESDPDTLEKPEQLISATDLNMTCVISYAGLSALDTVRRMMSATRQAR